MELVKQRTEDGTFIHAKHPLIDITLCMQALEGDSHKGKKEISVAKLVFRGKVNCPQCLEIINYCKEAPK